MSGFVCISGADLRQAWDGSSHITLCGRVREQILCLVWGPVSNMPLLTLNYQAAGSTIPHAYACRLVGCFPDDDPCFRKLEC